MQQDDILDWIIAAYRELSQRKLRCDLATLHILGILSVVASNAPFARKHHFPGRVAGCLAGLRPAILARSSSAQGPLRRIWCRLRPSPEFELDNIGEANFAIGSVAMRGYRTGPQYSGYVADLQLFLEVAPLGSTPRTVATWLVLQQILAGGDELLEQCRNHLAQRWEAEPKAEIAPLLRPTFAAVSRLVLDLTAQHGHPHLRQLQLELDGLQRPPRLVPSFGL